MNDAQSQSANVDPTVAANAGRAQALQAPRRVIAVDVFRGLVILILVPDVLGGFSFFRVAQELPDSAAWSSLGAAFRHVAWTGSSIWDLIMPAFLFIAAVSMPFSYAARRGKGETHRQVLAHMLLRAALLFVLGLLVKMPMDTVAEQAWPLILICAGLPVGEMFGRVRGIADARARERIQTIWSVAILAVCSAHIALNVAALGNYQFDGVFSVLALASIPAFALIGRPRRVQIGAAAAILIAYWLLFALWPVYPAPGPGAAPGEETLTGFFAHWNKNANAGYAIEVALMNALPRGEPFELHTLGLVSVVFVPCIVTMLFGVMAGELLRSGRRAVDIRNTLVRWGVAGVAAGLLAAYTLCPLIKILWTPSWVLFSSGVVALVLALIYQLCDNDVPRAWTFPLIVFGTNTVLLYTLATNYRWRFATLPERLLGFDVFTGPYAPLYESLVVGALLWCVAFVLYLAKIQIRL